MKPTGNTELLIAARRALLDALDALAAHRQSVIVIGAQAIYLHTGAAQSASPRPRKTATSRSTPDRCPTCRCSKTR